MAHTKEDADSCRYRIRRRDIEPLSDEYECADLRQAQLTKSTPAPNTEERAYTTVSG